MTPRTHLHGVAMATLMLLGGQTAAAATLHDFGQLTSGTVRLSDLFAGLGATPDRALGPAPAPGQRITVEAPQLAAIARDYSVDWRPETGAERVVLERAGIRLAEAVIAEKLRAALTEAGAPADGDIATPGFDPPLMPEGTIADTAVTEASFDPASGRFTAMLSVSATGMETYHARLSGQVAAMVDAAVLTHRLHPGALLAAEDLRTTRVRANLLRGNLPLEIGGALGQALRHDLPAGQPLTASDVTKPVLVARGSIVRMMLDAGGISLAAQGVALEDGGLGETVRVQNPTSKAVVLATVTEAGGARVLARATAAIEVAAQ